MQCLNSESKTILEKRGKAGPDPAVRPAGLVRFVPKMLPQYFLGNFSYADIAEKQNVHPRFHLPGGLQEVVHLYSRRCLWGDWGMENILTIFVMPMHISKLTD